MSDVTPTTPEASTSATIHDAIDALFTSKEAEPAAKPAPVETAPTVEGEAPEQAEAEPAVEVAPEPVVEAPKKSASDYALELARAKKKLAAAKAQIPRAPAPAQPSEAMMKRALAMEQAGDNPLKIFQATGLDLGALVSAFDKDMAENPDLHDPLAQQLREHRSELAVLREELAQIKNKEVVAQDEAAVTRFMADVAKRATGSDAYEYVAAHGAEGYELVKELVLEAARDGQKLMLDDALKMAESYYSRQVETLAKTKKLASKFSHQTRKPGIGQQAPAAGTAPHTQTKQRSVLEIINDEIDALRG